MVAIEPFASTGKGYIRERGRSEVFMSVRPPRNARGLDRQVLKAIDALDPPQPEVIKHSLMDGLTHPEIAEKMGLPLGTVKTHIRRGLIKVRKTLGIRPETAGAAS